MSDPSTEQFVRLFAQCEHELYRYVLTLTGNPADADDVMQETATALWRKFADYDPAKPFVPWAQRFAVIEVKRHRRGKATGAIQLSDEVVDKLADERIEAQSLLETQRRVLDLCMRELNDEQRKLIAHRYGATDTIRQLAQQLGRPVATLYKTLHRLRRRLIDCVDRRMESEGDAP